MTTTTPAIVRSSEQTPLWTAAQLFSDRPLRRETKIWASFTPCSQVPDWYHSLKARLEDLCTLPRNWDGEDGSGPTQSAQETAWTIFDKLHFWPAFAQPHVSPTPEGGLHFECCYGARDLDLDVLPDGNVEFLKSWRVGGAIHPDHMEDGAVDESDYSRCLNTLLKWLSGS